MTNTLLTVDWITRKAVQLFVNTNAFMQTVSRQYDDQWRNSEKIGSTLRVRLPIDPVAGIGQTVTPQSLNELNKTITIGTQRNVALGFTSSDLALKAEDFTNRYIKPSVNNLAGAVASDLWSLADTVPNITANFDGSGNVLSPTQQTWFTAGAVLANESVPYDMMRKAVLSPITQARTVAGLTGVFNPAPVIGRMFRVGAMNGNGQVFAIDDWRVDQLVPLHTTGAYSTLGTVSGASQTGSSVTVTALAGPLNAGDIVTFVGCNEANFVAKSDSGNLRQFVVTANVSTSATSIPIYPAITPVSGSPNTVQYANVTASPTDGGAIASPIKASAQIRKNLVFHPDAFAFVTADLPLYADGEGVRCARAMYDGVSLRVMTGVTILNDTQVSRLDILYGYAAIRPQWAVIVADIP